MRYSKDFIIFHNNQLHRNISIVHFEIHRIISTFANQKNPKMTYEIKRAKQKNITKYEKD